MSTDRITIGYVGQLVNKIEDQTEWYDRLREVGLYLNYEGTLVFEHQFDGTTYEFDIQVGMNHSKETFQKSCRLAGVPVLPGHIHPFFTQWYDGGDATYSMYTLDEFRARSGILNESAISGLQYIVFYNRPNESLDMQSIHSKPESAKLYIEVHAKAWNSNPKNFTVQVWAPDAGYVGDLEIS